MSKKISASVPVQHGFRCQWFIYTLYTHSFIRLFLKVALTECVTRSYKPVECNRHSAYWCWSWWSEDTLMACKCCNIYAQTYVWASTCYKTGMWIHAYGQATQEFTYTCMWVHIQRLGSRGKIAYLWQQLCQKKTKQKCISALFFRRDYLLLCNIGDPFCCQGNCFLTEREWRVIWEGFAFCRVAYLCLWKTSLRPRWNHRDGSSIKMFAYIILLFFLWARNNFWGATSV